MNLPLLNDSLSGFSNTCGVILGLLEEIFDADYRSTWLGLSRWRWTGRKISDDSLPLDRKLVDLHDYLYMGGFASLLSQNSYCATLRI